MALYYIHTKTFFVSFCVSDTGSDSFLTSGGGATVLKYPRGHIAKMLSTQKNTFNDIVHNDTFGNLFFRLSNFYVPSIRKFLPDFQIFLPFLYTYCSSK